MKHTPGPWNAPSAGVYAACGAMVASCGAAEIVRSLRRHGRVDRQEIPANARLVAAAPMLLEACERAVAHAEQQNDYDWIGAAIAAIAAAKMTTQYYLEAHGEPLCRAGSGSVTNPRSLPCGYSSRAEAERAAHSLRRDGVKPVRVRRGACPLDLRRWAREAKP